MQREFSPAQLAELKDLAGGKSFLDLAHALLNSCDPDAQIEAARKMPGVTGEPTEEQIKQAAEQLAQEGVTPFLKAAFRRRILEIRQQNEQTIDRHTTPCMENGKTAVVPEVPGQVCFGSTEFHVIRLEEGVARWVAQFLLQHEIRRAAQRQMTGDVGQMRVPAAFLQAVGIPLAPSAEQERIADVLDELFSDLDAGVAALERVREKLKLYRASVLKAAVEGTLTAEWRAQHPYIEPATELLKRILAERRRRWEEDQLAKFKAKAQEPPKNWKAKYKEPVAPDTTNSPPLPEGWCWVSFDQIGDTQGGLQKSPTRAPSKNHYPVANVHRGSLDLSELHRFELSDDELKTPT